MNDLELVKKCIDWDLVCFWKLYEKYVDKIYRFVYLKTTNTEVTEDIVSDVFMSALNKIDSFRLEENSSFGAWIYRIAHNKVIDYYKSSDKEVNFEDTLDLWYQTDFWKDIDNKEKLKDIFSYINTLKKEHKEVLIYRFWEDLSYREISELTWLSEDNCKQIVSRSLKNISANFTLLLLLLILIF